MSRSKVLLPRLAGALMSATLAVPLSAQTPAASTPAAAAAAQAAPPGTAAPPPRHWQQGGLVYDGIPAADPQLAARLARYPHPAAQSFVDWRAGGSLLLTGGGDTDQLQQLSAPLAAPTPLTRYPDPVREARAAPAGTGFVFLKDDGGNENAQLYYDPGDGKSAARQLTHGDFVHGGPVWAHDGKRVAFFGTDRDSVDYDIYVVDVAAGTAPQLLVGGRPGTWRVLDWSADDSRLLVQKSLALTDSTLYLADVASGALTALDAPQRRAGIYAARFAPDARGVYVLTDEDGESAQLKWKDPQTHEERRINGGSAWDVESFDVSADGRYIARVHNEDGRSRLAVLDTQTGEQTAPAAVPEGRIGNVRFDHSGRRLGFSVQSALSPSAVYVWEVGQAAVTRWSTADRGGLDPGRLTQPELIRYPTWDRSGAHARMLSAWVYRPRSPAPAPVLVYLHGAPQSQFRPEWDPFLQFVVNELGYAVIAPNVRGSSGYGKSFLALDNGLLREDAVRDVGALLVWIGVQPGLDRERVAVMGRAHGGYLALATLVNYGERLRGGIDVAGISDFVGFLRGTAGYCRDARRAEYGDERDLSTRVFLERISPLSNAARIRKPVLVVAGANDPRVPLSQSEQLVWGVRAAGGEAWFLTARDEGHEFTRQADRDAYELTAASFLVSLARR